MDSSPESARTERSLASGGNPQLSTPFLTILPLELRQMIFLEVWRSYNLQIHIFGKGDETTGPFTHAPCCTDTDAPDLRNQHYVVRTCDGDVDNHDFMELDDPNWQLRYSSKWCHHWACEEAADDGPPSPLLPIILTCKRFYAEGLSSFFDSVSIILNGVSGQRQEQMAYPGAYKWQAPPRNSPAVQFLDSYKHARLIRSLHLNVLLPPALIKTYSPRPMASEEELMRLSRLVLVDPSDTYWAHLCSTLASLVEGHEPRALRELRIWVEVGTVPETEWLEWAWETRIFQPLLQLDRVDLLLELPAVPPDSMGLLSEGQLLEDGETLKDNGSRLRILRGSRMNYVSV